MPLSFATIGQRNQIQRITGKNQVRNHLARLGFVVGEEITVVSVMGDHMILSVKDSRIALDNQLTQRIFI